MQAPELLYLKAGMSVTLAAEVLLPPCLDIRTPTVAYEWNNTAVNALFPRALAGDTSRLRLDPMTSASRALNLDASGMLHGFVYTLRLTGCLQADPSKCDFAEIDLALETEALQALIEGGQARSVGVGSPLSLNACRSCFRTFSDSQSSCEGLLFEWKCAPLSAEAVCPTFPLGRQPNCKWTVASNSFAVGNYSLSVNVTALLLNEQSAAHTRVEVIQSDISVAIATNVNVFASHGVANTDERGLHLTASIASDAEVEMEFSWSIAIYSAPIWCFSLACCELAQATHFECALLPSDALTLQLSTQEWPQSDARCHPHQVDATSAFGATASSWLTLKMNAPPFGGTMILSPDPPYVAILGEIILIASQWFDDPEDLPLHYAFFYADSEESWTPMSQAKLYPSHIWRHPPAGNFTLSCKIMDSFGAETVTQRQITVEQQVTFDSSSIELMLLYIDTRIVLGDAPGAVQLMDSLSITLNSQCSTRQGSSGPVLCSSLRGHVIDLLSSLSLEGINPLATQQRATMLNSLLRRSSELALHAMENAILYVGELLRVSSAGVSSGTAAKLLGSISSLLERTNGEAEKEMRSQSLNQTNCSGCLSALRTERLRNHTARLAELTLQGRAVGEAPTALSTPTIGIRAIRDDPCRVENTSFEAAPLDAGEGQGSVLFPSGTLCTSRAGRRMQTVSFCGDTSVSLFLLTFKLVIRAVSPPESLGTPVFSVQVKQCGEEMRVSDAISPIQLKMMPLPHNSPSYCRLNADGLLASVESIQWNTFSIDDVASVVTSFDFEQHRAILVFFFVLTGVNFFCLVWLGWYRQHRTGIARKRKIYEHDAAFSTEELGLKKTMQKATWTQLPLHTLCALFISPKEDEALTELQERVGSTVVQLFFNALMVDLVFACLNAPDISSATGGGRRGRGSAAEDAAERNVFRIDQFSKIDLVYATITGLIAAIGMSITIRVCTFVFRWGNSTHLTHLAASRRDASKRVVSSCLGCRLPWNLHEKPATKCTASEAPVGESDIDFTELTCSPPGSPPESSSPAHPPSTEEAHSSAVSSCPRLPLQSGPIRTWVDTCTEPKGPSDAPFSDAHTIHPMEADVQISVKQLENVTCCRSPGDKPLKRADLSEEELSGGSVSTSDMSKHPTESSGSPTRALFVRSVGSQRSPLGAASPQPEVECASKLLSADKAALSSPYKLRERNFASRVDMNESYSSSCPRKGLPPSTRRLCSENNLGSSSQANGLSGECNCGFEERPPRRSLSDPSCVRSKMLANDEEYVESSACGNFESSTVSTKGAIRKRSFEVTALPKAARFPPRQYGASFMLSEGCVSRLELALQPHGKNGSPKQVPELGQRSSIMLSKDKTSEEQHGIISEKSTAFQQSGAVRDEG
ncbi:MAG: hypothetical protein SGPRY_003993, partial [Prymnesium sp.]